MPSSTATANAHGRTFLTVRSPFQQGKHGSVGGETPATLQLFAARGNSYKGYALDQAAEGSRVALRGRGAPWLAAWGPCRGAPESPTAIPPNAGTTMPPAWAMPALQGRSSMNTHGHTRSTGLPLPIGDATLGQVVRRKLDADLVPRHNADEVLPHPSGHVGHHGVAALQLHPETRCWPGPRSPRRLPPAVSLWAYSSPGRGGSLARCGLLFPHNLPLRPDPSKPWQERGAGLPRGTDHVQQHAFVLGVQDPAEPARGSATRPQAASPPVIDCGELSKRDSFRS